ncbi:MULTISPECIES: DegT/DnrJ/EryC1/StrS family aminotransferase [unclassified Methylobacterium]|jgi:dTDP-4-amino-4,6-dideoxygalactose transaminase|uniref:DegT/DnrJ/EryC1/StrS family aminotransferase n=1 Tax=unclassified Methylobacterium TaxID=2615210 RepID=UPI0013538E4E|nr:DegT/DnrJ/EryC1/StrS aminotransferase family protein [Methylobacterium sp. 2A]MWV24701.1 DegT/DnrJ/EryC1/StrS aminotransferase family protein [Methylobacterium sp. 2A]
MLLVSSPTLGEAEKSALRDVVESGWITMGPRVRAFEERFAALHGAPDAVAVSSCTAALHLILLALGIGAGDEVLVPSMTFAATVNAVLYVGATPVMVDIASLDHPILSLADAEAKCTARTRAAIVMHYAGYVTDRDAWRALARRRNVLIVEDAAHAAGAAGVGTFGAATAFSFYGNKNMTTAEGGMILAEDPRHLALMRLARAHGLTSGTFERKQARAPTYDVVSLGYNYRLDEFRAALGLAQLDQLGAWTARRQALTQAYFAALTAQAPTVGLPFHRLANDPGTTSAHHIMPVLLPPGSDRDAIAGFLSEAGIQTTMHYPPAHRMTFYRSFLPEQDLPVTDAFARRQITLPLHPGLSEADVAHVARTLADALTHVARGG